MSQMDHITIREFQKLTAAKIQRLPHMIGIKSDDPIVALLIPHKPKRKRRSAAPKRTRRPAKKVVMKSGPRPR